MVRSELEALTLNELKQLRKDVVKAIDSYADRQKAEARVAVEAVARQMGYTLAELVPPEGRSNRIPAAPKYCHPDDPSLTWSGRGRRPKWFLDALAFGATIEDLSIG